MRADAEVNQKRSKRVRDREKRRESQRRRVEQRRRRRGGEKDRFEIEAEERTKEVEAGIEKATEERLRVI